MLSDQTHRIVERFQNGLESLRSSTERLERMLERMFDKLAEKGVRTNTDATTLIAEVKAGHNRVQQSSDDLMWLFQQSMELARVSALVGSSLNLREVLEGVMDTVIELTQAERAYVMLRQRGTNDMEIVAARNWEQKNVSEADVVFSHNVIQMALETGEPITTANAADDTRFRAAESIVQRNLRSILCVPLKLRGRIIGVLYADNNIQHGVFRPDSLPIMVAFAQQVAVAIENARLYQRLEHINTQLEEANQLKAEFLSVISHELKTPFAGLGFAVQIFPRYGMDHLSDDQRKVWDDLVGGVEKAQTLVNSLVNYAGLLSKQGTLELTRFDIVALLNETLEDAARMARSRNITVHTEFPTDAMVMLGDRERLGEAFWHLLQNAIQYNQADGHVWVRIARHDSNIVVVFEDSGVGIPASEQERIWGAFEQMASSLTRGQEGLGLGLPLVRWVVNAHNGDVTLHSIVNEGSQFTVTLPLM